MKARIQFRVVTAFMVAWVAASGVCPGLPYDMYIVGQITDASTGAGIPDAYVEARAVGFPGTYDTSSHTDASGVYVLQPLTGSGYLYEILAGARNHTGGVAEIYCPPGPVATYSVYLALSPVDGKPSLQVASLLPIVALNGTIMVRVDDADDLGVGPGTFQASQDSGPGGVSFSWEDHGSLYDCHCTFPALGVYRLRFTYTDGYGDVGFTTVDVTVHGPGGTTPVAEAGGPYTGHVGQNITLDGSRSYDVDGDPITYGWDLDNDGQYDDATTVIVQHTWNAPFSGSIGLRVTDIHGNTGTVTATVTITQASPGDSDACSLLAYWDFEEGSGLVAHDVSGNGHHGQLMGSVSGGPAWGAGYDGGALQFNGVDAYVDTGITDDLAQWTICCWVGSPAAPWAWPVERTHTVGAELPDELEPHRRGDALGGRPESGRNLVLGELRALGGNDLVPPGRDVRWPVAQGVQEWRADHGDLVPRDSLAGGQQPQARPACHDGPVLRRDDR